MSSAAPNPYILLRHALDRMSPLDTSIVVLFASFVGHLVTFSNPRS